MLMDATNIIAIVSVMEDGPVPLIGLEICVDLTCKLDVISVLSTVIGSKEVHPLRMKRTV